MFNLSYFADHVSFFVVVVVLFDYLNFCRSYLDKYFYSFFCLLVVLLFAFKLSAFFSIYYYYERCDMIACAVCSGMQPPSLQIKLCASFTFNSVINILISIIPMHLNSEPIYIF